MSEQNTLIHFLTEENMTNDGDDTDSEGRLLLVFFLLLRISDMDHLIYRNL